VYEEYSYLSTYTILFGAKYFLYITVYICVGLCKRNIYILYYTDYVMKRGEMLGQQLVYEGKSKRLYSLDEDRLVMEFKDDVTSILL